MITITLGAYSYNDPAEIDSLVREWLGNSSKPERIEVIISLEIDDEFFDEYTRVLAVIESEYDIIIKIVTGTNLTWIQGINRIKNEFTGDVIVICPNGSESSQDWDSVIDEAYSNMPGSYVIKTNDSDLMKVPCFTSSYLKHKMWIYYPGYLGFFHEMELAAVVNMEDKIIDLSHLEFKDTSRLIEIYSKDIKKFAKRLRLNFHMQESLNPRIPKFIHEWIEKNGDGSESEDSGDIELFME